jgi:cell division protein FtsW
MILAGVAYYILLHFILNVGGVSALIPLTGVPLLFISSGGSSTISIMIALGIAQRVISLERSKVKP